MERYIDSNKLIDFCNNHISKTIDANDIARFPCVDVAEVKHGYWIDTTAYCGEFTCSICKEMCVTNKYKYCPHCGAKMDGDKE